MDPFEGLIATIRGGIDRLELFSFLRERELSPSADLMQAAAQTRIPCHAMMQPHAGDFNYDPHAIEKIADDISNAQIYNLLGVVFGIKDGSGNLDTKFLACLMDEAQRLNTTLHLLVDKISNLLRPIDQAIELSFD